MRLAIKRIYDPPAADDGYRVLVDRLWPRGLTKDEADLDRWLKDIAPSPGLRTWWNHDPARFEAFSERYQAELDHNPSVQDLHTMLDQHPTVTLVFGARDERINHATVLAEYLETHQNASPAAE